IKVEEDNYHQELGGNPMIHNPYCDASTVVPETAVEKVQDPVNYVRTESWEGSEDLLGML
ncbi:hypothetical protein KIL84_020178, partial [Mauremys mutica]